MFITNELNTLKEGMAECPEGANGTVTVTEEATESPSVCAT